MERHKNVLRITKLKGYETLHVSEVIAKLEQFVMNQEKGTIFY